MKGIGYFYKPIKKRPELLFIFGIITFIYCFIEYNFIMPVANVVTVLRTGNILDSIMHLIQLVLNYVTNIKPASIIFTLIGLMAVSLVAGLFLSGYLNVLNSSFIDTKRVKGNFGKGVRKHFVKISRITFVVMLFSLVFVVFMLVVSVPSIVITNAAITDKPELLGVSIVLDFITIGIMFFSVMFFKIYMFFWYPAAINSDKKFFERGKRAADASFWSIVLRFVLFDILIILLQIVLFIINAQLSKQEGGFFEALSVFVLLFVNWILKTVVFSSVISYVFSKFIIYKNKAYIVKEADAGAV